MYLTWDVEYEESAVMLLRGELQELPKVTLCFLCEIYVHFPGYVMMFFIAFVYLSIFMHHTKPNALGYLYN
jgi:hypothetical protein